MPRSIGISSDHIVVVLRRSPVRITSSTPLTRQRADGTLPRPQLDQELEGRHRAERVLNTEVPYVRYLNRLDREDVRLHQPRYKRLRFRSTRVRGHTLPVSLLCIS